MKLDIVEQPWGLEDFFTLMTRGNNGRENILYRRGKVASPLLIKDECLRITFRNK